MSSLDDGRQNGAGGAGIPGIHPAYGAFQTPEVQLAM